MSKAVVTDGLLDKVFDPDKTYGYSGGIDALKAYVDGRRDARAATETALSHSAEAVEPEQKPVAWLFEGEGWGSELMFSYQEALRRKARLSRSWEINITPLYAREQMSAALSAAMAQAEPVAAYTVDHTGCEHLSRDITGVERIAAAGAKGPTPVEYLYASPPVKPEGE